MQVMDAQVHAYERDHPGRPWAGRLPGAASATAEEMVSAMDATGVDGAILVSPLSLYRFDPGYALEAYRAHPDRFRVVKPIDPADPALRADLDRWSTTDGTVGVRILLQDGLLSDPADSRLTGAFAAAGALGLPVNLLCWGRLAAAGALARACPGTLIVIDHLGLQQPQKPSPDPWADLPRLLALADHPNVRVKISGACMLSHEPFPYADIWDPIRRIIDRFGVDRCLWGTDWTRTLGVVSYDQATRCFLETTFLSPEEKAQLMGGTLRQVYRWQS